MSTFNVHPNTVPAQLLHWANTDPEAVAFICRSADPNNPRLTLTRQEVFTFASRYAAILKRKGIQHGDVVCNILPNSPERLLTDMGIMVAGAVTLNGVVFLVDGADLVGSLRRSKCKAIITTTGQASKAMSVLEKKLVSCDDEGVVDCPDVPTMKYLLKVNCQANKDGLKPFIEDLKRESDQYVGEVRPSDMAFIMTTSGSTGFSKLVPRTHSSLLEVGKALAKTVGQRDDDIYFNDRSLGWLGGAPTLYLISGRVRILTDLSTPPADPLALFWSIVWEENVTLAAMVPLHISMSVDRPDLLQNKRKLRCLLSGGQPLMKHHLKILDNVTDSLCMLYGSTEVGFSCSWTITAENREIFENGDNGVPAEDMELKLLDENEQEIKEEEKVGEVVVKGKTVFTGYLGLEKEDERDFFTKDGFFRTNDMAFWNSHGHLCVVCRKSNAITHGAFIVYPGWLESRMEMCPGVQNVIVVPVPDPNIYNELCACVVAKKNVKVTGEDVREFCKSLFIVSEKDEMSAVPKFYVFFDSFPTTSTGKPDRTTIRTIALEKLGMQDSSITPSGKGN